MICKHCSGELQKDAPAQSGIAKVFYKCKDCGKDGFYSQMVSN